MRRIVFGFVVVLGVLGGCKSGRAPTSETVPANAPAAQPVPAPSGEPRAERASRHPRPGGGGTPGQFDFYLFTMSWSPEFCVTHGSDPECGLHLGYTVHGLWPQDTNGSYPEACSNQAGPSNPGAWSDIFPDASLLAHEWKTHGTCSGLGPDAYLGEIRQAFHAVAIPAQLNAPAAGTMLAPAVILGDFAAANPGFPQGSFVLSCGNNQLTAVQVCLSKTLGPIACSGVKTCGATVVKIAPRGQ